jgi:cytochrome P450
VAPALAPAALVPFGPAIEEHVRVLIDGLATDGTVDLVATLTAQVPARTLLHLLGLEEVDEERVRAWTSAFSDGISPWARPGGEARAGAALAALRDHLRPVLDARAERPRPDLLTALATNPSLDGDEALQQAVLLCTAGLDTTADLLASAVAATAAEPGLWAALVDDPAGRAPNLVEETLRCESPVPFLMRRLVEPVEVAGEAVAAGTPVLLAVGAANRDERVFTDAERFDPSRMERGERRHLAFGSGVHRCLGAPLARMQGAIVLRELARRFPTLRLAEPVVARPRLFLRGPEAVRVRLSG